MIDTSQTHFNFCYGENVKLKESPQPGLTLECYKYIAECKRAKTKWLQEPTLVKRNVLS